MVLVRESIERNGFVILDAQEKTLDSKDAGKIFYDNKAEIEEVCKGAFIFFIFFFNLFRIF